MDHQNPPPKQEDFLENIEILSSLSLGSSQLTQSGVSIRLKGEHIGLFSRYFPP